MELLKKGIRGRITPESRIELTANNLSMHMKDTSYLSHLKVPGCGFQRPGKTGLSSNRLII